MHQWHAVIFGRATHDLHALTARYWYALGIVQDCRVSYAFATLIVSAFRKQQNSFVKVFETVIKCY